MVYFLQEISATTHPESSPFGIFTTNLWNNLSDKSLENRAMHEEDTEVSINVLDQYASIAPWHKQLDNGFNIVALWQTIKQYELHSMKPWVTMIHTELQ